MSELKIDEDYYFLLVFGMKMTSPHKSTKEYLILGGENNIKSKFIIVNIFITNIIVMIKILLLIINFNITF
jgi:hypothetical protein